MRKSTAARLAAWGTLAATVALLSACSETGSPMAPSDVAPIDVQPSFLVSDIATVVACSNTDIELGKFKLIKRGGSGTFDISINDVFVGTVTLDDGECARIHLNTHPAPENSTIVTATETSGTPELIELQVIRIVGVTGGVTTVVDPVVEITGSNTVSGPAWGQKGSRAIVHNGSPPPPPPPPPPGGDGCTPGFWKQSQHFGWWTAPFTPSTQFSAVFEDAFPGKTLLQVLKQGGGGLKALGRHTIAALLNAASPDVASDATVAQVIAAFNAVYPGGDVEGLKNIFEASNEQGCPLDRNEGDGGTTF